MLQNRIMRCGASHRCLQGSWRQGVASTSAHDDTIQAAHGPTMAGSSAYPSSSACSYACHEAQFCHSPPARRAPERHCATPAPPLLRCRTRSAGPATSRRAPAPAAWCPQICGRSFYHIGAPSPTQKKGCCATRHRLSSCTCAPIWRGYWSEDLGVQTGQ